MATIYDIARERANKRGIMSIDRYRAFQEKYRDDPVGFVRDCIRFDDEGEGLADYQRDVASHIIPEKRVSARGPHGLGKSMLSSVLILWFALTRDGQDWKVVTTASAWRQLTKYLWPEVHKWARRIKWRKVGRKPFQRHELMTTGLRLDTGEAFAVASNNPSYIEGAHADEMLYIFDESKAIPAATFDAAEGAFSGKGNHYAVAVSTPGDVNGRFYDIQSKKPGYEDWWVKHVTVQEMIKAGRQSREWVDQRRKQWGEQSAIYKNRVLGEFANTSENGIIPLSWVELANERWYEWVDAGRLGKVEAIGGDVGITNDKSVAALNYDGTKIDTLQRFSKPNPEIATMEITGRFLGIMNNHINAPAIIDVIGIGAGVVHRLNELGKNVVAYNAAEKTDTKDRLNELGFVNKRSAAWWMVREMLDPEIGDDIALPPDDELMGDLTTPTYRVMSGGKIQVESKKDIRKRIGRSTDAADAVIQALVGRKLAGSNVTVLSASEYMKTRANRGNENV